MRIPAPPRLEPVKGVYYAFWRDTVAKRGKRRSLNTADPVEAAEAFAALVRVLYGRPTDPGRHSFSVGDALDLYLSEHIDRKAVGKTTAQFRLAHIRAHFGALPLARVGIEACHDYLTTREARGVSPGTVRGELAYLQAAANFAVRRGKIDRTQLPTLDLPPVALPRERWLSFGEWKQLLRAAAEVWDNDCQIWRRKCRDEPLPRIYLFTMLAYYTASRKKAIETLEWRQVDFDNGLIHLNPPGRRQTRKRRPTVPIHPKLLPVLKWAMGHRDGRYVLRGGGEIRTAFETVVRRASLGADVTPHVLRHTRATHLSIRGVAMQDIADLLGDTLAVVEKTYRHMSPHHLREKLRYV